VRYNYDADDLNILVEVIGYIKALSCTAMQAEEYITTAVAKVINTELQLFVQGPLGEAIAKCKKEKDLLKALEDTQKIFRWFSGAPESSGKAKGPPPTRESRASVSIHQLDVIRTEIQNYIRSNSKFFKHLKGLLTHVQAFLAKSYDWYYMIDPVDVIREATNLSSLWFREVYLQLDHTIQFPVRSSLPFILIEHLLHSLEHPELHDSMMFPFEIYNDSAYAALNTYESQYLYREVEAEVALSVDMIAFTFSETIFKCCREAAAAIESPAHHAGMIAPSIMRYNIMVSQNRLQLLGSAIDFNLVATTKLNAKIRKELESYIETMVDFRQLPYIAHLFRVIRTTHSLLVQNNLRMDDFDSIWQRAKGFTNPLALDSNLVAKISGLFDFTRWQYNADSRRFTGGKPLQIVAQTTEEWSGKYALMHVRDKSYIGADHIRALTELLSPGEISCILQDLHAKFESSVVKLIAVYTGIAPSIRLTACHSKNELQGFFSFNTDAYSQLQVPNLGAFLNQMRLVGNTIACVQLIEDFLPISASDKYLLEPFFQLIKNALESNMELFTQSEGFDLYLPSSHSSFTSRWCVLELVMTMDEVKVSDRLVKPLAEFGDGPAYAAQLLITLLGQEALYRFDSLLRRTVELQHVEALKSFAQLKELPEWLKRAQAIISAMDAADRVAAQYK
jgi:cytoplasmic FMR1 interacting protein